MLLHISSDQILLQYGDERELVPFDDIERSFPKILHTWYSTYQPQKIAVINGPGSFTQLRVASIACNILNLCNEMQIDFLDISKISLYNKAMEEGLLPSVGVVFMGQRKKMWLVQHTTALEGEGATLQSQEFPFVDSEHVLDFLAGRKYYTDWMVGNHSVLDVLEKEYMLSGIHFVDGTVYMEYKGREIAVDADEIGNIVKQLEPRYLMEPQVG